MYPVTTATSSMAIASMGSACVSSTNAMSAALNPCSSFASHAKPLFFNAPTNINAGIFSSVRALPSAEEVVISSAGATSDAIPVLMSAAYGDDPAQALNMNTESYLRMGGGFIAMIGAFLILRAISKQASARPEERAVSDWQPDEEMKQPSEIANAIRPKSINTGTSLAPPKDSGHHHGNTGVH